MRYEPARADGLKPWIVTTCLWGGVHGMLVWAESSRMAKRQVARGRSGTVRRAQPTDIRGAA